MKIGGYEGVIHLPQLYTTHTKIYLNIIGNNLTFISLFRKFDTG